MQEPDVMKVGQGGKKMLINVTGKQKALEDLERAENLIREAHDILWRLPSAIGLEMTEGSFETNDTVQNNQ